MAERANPALSASQFTVEDRLHFALALLSGLEFGKPCGVPGACPICGWPIGGHDGVRHEPGCSLEAVLLGRVPHRLVWMEETYACAAYGANGRDRKRFTTPIVEPVRP
jgi:hypothetical protein